MQMLVALSIANEILHLTQHMTWLYGRSHFDARPSASRLRKTPRAERSAISAGVPFSISVSFTTGSLFTSFHKIEARSPTASLISLCRSVTSPPFLQESACCKSKSCWHPSHLEKERLSGFLYLTHIASLNSVADKSKLSFNKCGEASHKEQLLSIILQITRFWSAGKTARNLSSLSLSIAFCSSSWFFLSSLIFVLCRVWSKSSWRRIEPFKKKTSTKFKKKLSQNRFALEKIWNTREAKKWFQNLIWFSSPQ